MKIFLIRHCATEDQIAGIGNTDDSHIAKTFRAKEIQDLQKLCKNVDKVYCSPLIRAKETAEILVGDNYEVLPWIYEYRRPKCLNGKSAKEIKKFWEKHDKDKLGMFWRYDDSESLGDIRSRVNMLDRFLQNSEYKSVAIIGHGTFFKHFLMRGYTPWSFSDYVKVFFNMVQPLEITNLKVIEVKL